MSIDDGANSIAGRSIINDRAVIPQAQEHVPVTEDVRALRAALNTLGDGLVEAIDDSTLLAIGEDQPEVMKSSAFLLAFPMPSGIWYLVYFLSAGVVQRL